MCGVKLRDKLSCIELRQQLVIEDVVKVVQRNRLWWYGHVLIKNEHDWVKNCITLEFEAARQRGRPRKTWQEIVDKDMDDLQIKLSDDLDCCKWMRMNWRELE